MHLSVSDEDQSAIDRKCESLTPLREEQPAKPLRVERGEDRQEEEWDTHHDARTGVANKV